MRKKYLIIFIAGMLLTGCGKNENTTVVTTTATQTGTIEQSIAATKEQTENQTQTNAATESASETTTKAFNIADIKGVWNRTNIHRSFPGEMTITSVDEKGFDFDIECGYYSHSGVLSSRAEFVSEGKAVCEIEEYYGDEQPVIEFEFDKDILKINTVKGHTSLPFGMNVTMDGEYIMGEPEYTNANIIAETFSDEELEAIKKAINDDSVYEEYFVFPMEFGNVVIEDCAVKNRGAARIIAAAVPTIAGYDFTMLITEKQEVYIRFGSYSIPYKTNTNEIDFPEYAIF